jgi:cellulose biosynthesis protein BcsQ
MKTIAFFNNKGGVGKTSLVYHLAWTFHDLGFKVLAVDLDPQTNLSAMCLSEQRMDEILDDSTGALTVLGAVHPIFDVGDVKTPHLERVRDNLHLVVGDLGLARIEDELGIEWDRCLTGKPRPFRIVTVLYRAIRLAAQACGPDVILADVGPNLGAINRSAMLCADGIVVPLTPDLYSFKGLQNLGPTLREWREQWTERRSRMDSDAMELPPAAMNAIGYIVMQHAVRSSRPVQVYRKWIERVPGEYRRAILQEGDSGAATVDSDPHCLGLLKHYWSLMPMAMEARKPIFHLTAADGALGGHTYAASDCGKDFRQLARHVAERAGIEMPG